MSNVNPYQSPNASEPLNGEEYFRVAKSFSYAKTQNSKGVIFTGTIVAGADGLYLSHDKHTWQTSATWAAMFGLLGVAINAWITRNKKFEYPYPVLPPEELPDSIQDVLQGHKFKPNSMVSIIPKAEIVSYASSMMGKKFTLADGAEITLLAAVGKGMKQLPNLGYEKA